MLPEAGPAPGLQAPQALITGSRCPHPPHHPSSQQHFLIHCLAPRVKQNVGTWVPPKQPMTLSWIGQKTPGAGGVTKPKVFGLQVALSGHQAQILEPRDKGVCVLWCCIIVLGVNSQVGVGFV